eukprot:1558825-Rhodomonas_salina.4
MHDDAALSLPPQSSVPPSFPHPPRTPCSISAALRCMSCMTLYGARMHGHVTFCRAPVTLYGVRVCVYGQPVTWCGVRPGLSVSPHERIPQDAAPPAPPQTFPSL